MKKMFLFFSHILTDLQKKEAEEEWGINEFVYLPEDLQRKWSQIDPFSESVDIKPFTVFLMQKANKGDIVLIQGDYGAVFSLVNIAFENDLLPVYATSVRRKKIISNNMDAYETDYKHCRFRRYK